jgi:hypothetical protein
MQRRKALAGKPEPVVNGIAVRTWLPRARIAFPFLVATHRTWLAVFGVGLLLVSPLWLPTPDSVSYLSISRSLAFEGVPRNLGSPHPMYSIGYPVLTIPVLRTGSFHPFMLLSIFRTLFAFAFFFTVKKWASRLSGISPDLITNLTLANVVVLALFRRDLSEVAFMPILFASANAFHGINDRFPKPGWRFPMLAGFMLLLLVTIRPTGLLFAGGFGIWLLVSIRRKKIDWKKAISVFALVVAPALIGLSALMAYEQITASHSGQISNFDMLLNHRLVEANESLPERLLEGLRVRISEIGRLTVPGMFGARASHGNWLDWNLLMYIPVFGILWRGWWKWLSEKADVLALTFPIYFALHVYWPWDQAGRYFAPLLPVLFVCLWFGLDFLGSKRLQLFQILLLIHVIVSLSFWIVRDLPRGLENRRDFPALASLAKVIREDNRPVAASNGAADAGLILAWLLDRPVEQLQPRESISEPIHWLVLLEGEFAPPEFESAGHEGRFQLFRRSSNSAGRTSTRLSKNVAPPPKSVSRVLEVELQLAPSGKNFLHQMPSVTTTPRFTVSPILALATNDPRSLKIRTLCPSAIPRSFASSGWISSVGSPAAFRNISMLTNVEFRNSGCGGLSICSG